MNMTYFGIFLAIVIAFVMGVFIGPKINKTQEQKSLERSRDFYDKTYLRNSAVTSLWKPEGWEHEYFSYDLRSWDAGKTWYALEMEKPNGTALKEDRIIILGEVEDVYPGLMSHNTSWDRLIKHIKKEGPIDNVNEAEELLDGTGITIEVDYSKNIGKKVTKKRENKSGEPRQPKPFKSGLQTNTIKGVIEHPQLNIPAYTFEEDDSYVECRRCYLVDDTKK